MIWWASWKEDVVAEVRTIAVIGAGTMGRGIAHVAALGGYRRSLRIAPQCLAQGESEFAPISRRTVELGKISAGAAEAALSRLEYAGSVEEAAGSHLY